MSVSYPPDLSKQPDCLDDIITLSVAMCSVCHDCVMNFWSTRRETIAPANGGDHGIVLGETVAVGEEEEVL